MNKLIHSVIVTLFCLLGNNILAQQLPYRSALGTSDFQFNPAMTAPGEYMESGANYRKQWSGFEEAPLTSSFYIQYPFIRSNMSIGGSIGHDEVGPLQRNDVSLNYSYKIEIGFYGQLSLGILANIGQYQFNGKNTIAADQNDALILYDKSTAVIPNFGFGLFYISNKGMYDLSENAFFIGLGSNQLLNNRLLFEEQTNLKRSIHANATFGGRIINDFGYIEPSLWVDYSSLNLLHFTGNIIFEMENTFWAGFSLSSDLLATVQVGINLSNSWLKDGQLRVGVLGSYSLGTLSTQQGLGYEFLVSYKFEL